MNWKLITLVLVLLGFSALSAYSMVQVGYLGIWKAGMANPGALQILADVVIVCCLAIAWMVQDARHRGVAVWPYVLITLTAGSFGPLLYLIRREWVTRDASRPVPQYG
ncbi:MAG: DUF2834 domain-containing protein [Xanthomonadales bacterium]|nr:DUF2834 domain-containing protein [Xanthomonadales bacterium]